MLWYLCQYATGKRQNRSVGQSERLPKRMLGNLRYLLLIPTEKTVESMIFNTVKRADHDGFKMRRYCVLTRHRQNKCTVFQIAKGSKRWWGHVIPATILHRSSMPTAGSALKRCKRHGVKIWNDWSPYTPAGKRDANGVRIPKRPVIDGLTNAEINPDPLKLGPWMPSRV